MSFLTRDKSQKSPIELSIKINQSAKKYIANNEFDILESVIKLYSKKYSKLLVRELIDDLNGTDYDFSDLISSLNTEKMMKIDNGDIKPKRNPWGKFAEPAASNREPIPEKNTRADISNEISEEFDIDTWMRSQKLD